MSVARPTRLMSVVRRTRLEVLEHALELADLGEHEEADELASLVLRGGDQGHEQAARRCPVETEDGTTHRRIMAATRSWWTNHQPRGARGMLILGERAWQDERHWHADRAWEDDADWHPEGPGTLRSMEVGFSVWFPQWLERLSLELKVVRRPVDLVLVVQL